MPTFTPLHDAYTRVGIFSRSGLPRSLQSSCIVAMCVYYATTDAAVPDAKRVTMRSPLFKVAASRTTAPSAAVVSE